MDMDSEKFIINVVSKSILFCIVYLILKYFDKKSAKKCYNNLLTKNLEASEFKQTLSRGKFNRAKVIKGYYNFLLYLHTEYRNYKMSKRWFKNKHIPAASRQHQIESINDLFSRIYSYLESDSEKYLDGNSQIRCENLLAKIKHMLTEITQNIKGKKPLYSLESYSKYFDFILKVCTQINDGVRRRNTENQEVILFVLKNEQLLQKYAPISKWFNNASNHEQRAFKIINENYSDKIVKEVRKAKDIKEYTNFIFFDKVIIFCGKFYDNMDAIKKVE